MGWVERGWKHVLRVLTASAVVVVTVATTVPAVAGPKVPGIDVSKYQGRIHWHRVATTPIRFAIMRATLGNDYRDERYPRNLAGATANGLVVGAYHFAKPDLARWDPRAEADHFLRVARVAAGDIVPVLDIEESGPLSPRQLRRWAEAWLEHVEMRTGVRAMIYSGNHFWRGSMGNTRWFARRGHPLWVAHWYVPAPAVPGGRWGGEGYTIWQHSATGKVFGIRGDVDRDWVRGTLANGTIASIEVRAAEGGLISGDRILCGARLTRCSRLANPGDLITLRATPRPGARLVRWTGACAPADDARSCTVEAIRAKTVSAVFGQPLEAVIGGGEGADGRSPSAPACEPVCPAPSVGAPGGTGSVPDPGARPSCDGEDHDCTIAVLLADQLESAATPSPGALPPPSVSPSATPPAVPSPAPPSSTAPSPASRSSASGTPSAEAAPSPASMITPDEQDAAPGDGVRYDWGRERSDRAIGGWFRWERRRSASISFGFRGGAVTLFTVRGPAMGRARISIDGEAVATIDGYARRLRTGVAHRFDGLGGGAHRLTVTPLGTKRRAATDHRVAVDALRWGGRLRPEPKPEEASWATVPDRSADDGGYVLSDAPGAGMTLEFSGSALSVLAMRGPTGGRALLSIDGRPIRTLDLYAPRRRFQRITIAVGLPDGPHEARVVILDDRHRRSEGHGVAIDRWIVLYRPERSRPGHVNPHQG